MDTVKMDTDMDMKNMGMVMDTDMVMEMKTIMDLIQKNNVFIEVPPFQSRNDKY